MLLSYHLSFPNSQLNFFPKDKFEVFKDLTTDIAG